MHLPTENLIYGQFLQPHHVNTAVTQAPAGLMLKSRDKAGERAFTTGEDALGLRLGFLKNQKTVLLKPLSIPRPF